MAGNLAIPLLLIGGLTLVGTIESILVGPQMQRLPVPVCCRRRVDTFQARAPWIALSAAASTMAGLVLLFL
jgi:hypothetical protein